MVELQTFQRPLATVEHLKILISEGNKKSGDGIFAVDKVNCSSVQKKLLKRMLEADDTIEMKKIGCFTLRISFLLSLQKGYKKQYIILL